MKYTYVTFFFFYLCSLILLIIFCLSSMLYRTYSYSRLDRENLVLRHCVPDIAFNFHVWHVEWRALMPRFPLLLEREKENIK